MALCCSLGVLLLSLCDAALRVATSVGITIHMVLIQHNKILNDAKRYCTIPRDTIQHSLVQFNTISIQHHCPALEFLPWTLQLHHRGSSVRFSSLNVINTDTVHHIRLQRLLPNSPTVVSLKCTTVIMKKLFCLLSLVQLSTEAEEEEEEKRREKVSLNQKHPIQCL